MLEISRRIFDDKLIDFKRALSARTNQGYFLGSEIVYRRYPVIDDDILTFAHPNLVTILGKTHTNSLITEYLPRTTQLAKTRLSSQAILQITLGLCAGLVYLKEIGINNLTKPLSMSAVLITDTLEAKINESVFVEGKQTAGKAQVDDTRPLGLILNELLLLVSAEKDGILRQLRDVAKQLNTADPCLSLQSLFKMLRAIGKSNRPDETEALTPFLLGQ